MRGQPLAALVLLLVAWVGFRAIFWNTAAVSAVGSHGFAALQPGDEHRSPTGGSGGIAVGPRSVPGEGPFAFAAQQTGGYAQRGAGSASRFGPLGQAVRRVLLAGDRNAGPSLWGLGGLLAEPFSAPESRAFLAPANRPVPVRIATAQQLLWMAAVSRMPLPFDLFTGGGSGGQAPLQPSGVGSGSGKRWSADALLLLRKGGNVSLSSGVLPATYGASQLGAVLRYRIAPDSSHRPSAYLRTTAALNGSREREAALGLSARPVPGFPIAAAAELRATDRPGSRQVRPAVLAWTEIAPFDLPLGTRGEFYAQGGYVGGKFKTPFADGQLRVDRLIAEVGRAEIRAGGGVWGGTQKGASRLDLGPTATMGLPISDSASARVGVDWRFRVTGNAEPESGPALTLSAGF